MTRAGIPLSQWRVIVLSSLGGALEFYDFVIYSVFAQYIGAAFFPASDPLTSLILSFSVFAVGYLFRPLGGIVFSHFGDRYGRRLVFIVAILTMSMATLAMGVLPTFATWGIGASVLMVLLRLVQGFCLGGELPGAITYVVETAPRSAGFAAGFIFFCVNSGVALASLLSLTVHTFLLPDQVAQWGWRLGFLFGGFAGLLSFYLRLSLEETPEFALMRQGRAKRPFIEVIRAYPVQVLIAIAALTATAGFNGLLFAMPAFLSRVMGYSPLIAIKAQNVCLLVLSFGLLGAAKLGDRIPRRYIMAAGALLLAVLSFPFFNAAGSHRFGILPLFAGAGLVASLVSGPMSAIAADLFPTRIRFTGVALSYNLAFSIFSGAAPLAATLLVRTTGSPSGPAYFMCGCALTALLGCAFAGRYDGWILSERAAAPGSAAAATKGAL